jgi:hypothetical protein
MDDLDNIFDPTDESADALDVELATAGAILVKMAEEEGIDLTALPKEDVADLLTKIAGGHPAAQQSTPEPETKEASKNMEELTHADVAAELAKIAADNEIDLNDVSREEYHQAYDNLAARMQDPAYFEEKVAMQEKLAEADTIGRHMAQSFMDELNNAEKLANPAEFAERARWTEGKPDPKVKLRPRDATNTPGPASRMGRVREMAGGAARKADDAVSRLGEYASRAVTKKPLSRGRARLVGGGLVGTGLLTTGGATYAATRGRKEKEQRAGLEGALENDAVAYAEGLLVENGLIDGQSTDYSDFAKFAGDEYAEYVEKRAYELLEENGWLKG